MKIECFQQPGVNLAEFEDIELPNASGLWIKILQDSGRTHRQDIREINEHVFGASWL